MFVFGMKLIMSIRDPGVYKHPFSKSNRKYMLPYHTYNINRMQ
jgi:hypothetical protein